MAVSLSHFGETLVARMVSELRGDFLDLCKLNGSADKGFLANGHEIAFRERPLLPYGGIGFDGASRVDLVVRLSKDEGTPFEIKLGATRLSKTRIDEEWLSGCDFSHGGKRFRGNMMSILERKFPKGVLLDDLRIEIAEKAPLKLTPTWFVIAKNSVLRSWRGKDRPAFSNRVRLLPFEDIVDRYGGKKRFNKVVEELLSFDYYDQWVKGKGS